MRCGEDRPALSEFLPHAGGFWELSHCGGFTLEVEERRLQRGAESVRVAPKAFDVLVELLRFDKQAGCGIIPKPFMGAEDTRELLPGMHGYGIVSAIQLASDGVLGVVEGALYPALHRLEVRGWVRSKWGTSDNNRRAKFYRLSALGRRALEEEAAYWDRVASAVTRVMQGA